MNATRRILLIFAGSGLTAVAYGTSQGIAPAWPARGPWVALLLVAATFVLTYAFTLHRRALQAMTAFVILAALLRAAGFAFVGAITPTNGSRWTGTGVWVALAALTYLMHIGERRRLRNAD